jgi:peroxiredoxin
VSLRRRALASGAFVASLASLASLLACGGETSTAWGPSAPAPATASGAMAPDFTARDLDGRTFRLADHLGKEVVLLDFWSTYCEPCKAEFPHLRSMYDEQKARGLLVVGVAMDGPESVADVPAFARRHHIEFPIVLDDDSRIASLYDPKKSMPLTVLIGRDGRMAVVREGYNPGDEKLLAADVARALDAAAAPR